MDAIIQSDGSDQTRPYANSVETALGGYYSLTSTDTNGRHAYTRAGASATISWDGSKWVWADGGTTYYTSTDDVWAPYKVTTWTQVDGVNTPLVTLHAPRDWTINGLTANNGAQNVAALIRSKVGIEDSTANNVTMTSPSPVSVFTDGESPVWYRTLFDPATCSLPTRTDNVGTGEDYVPFWGNVAFNANPATSLDIDPASYPYIPDGFRATVKSANGTEITLGFEGSGGPDSISFTNAAPKTLIFDKPTETWTEVV
jgi:hypothetical protein